MIENVFIADINGVKTILTDKINTGDSVIGFFERPVDSYWVKDCICRNKFEEGNLKELFLIFKDGISCGVANDPYNHQKWFKVLGVLK